MTAREWIADVLSQGPRTETMPLELRLTFRLLHDYLPELRLRNGAQIGDTADMREFCREVIDVLSPVRPIRPPKKDVCSVCFHHHEGIESCGVNLGGGGICDCKLEVSA